MTREYPIGTLRPASFRWKAVGIHLAISLAILAILLYILFVHWFPGHLFDTDGGWQALQIIVGVDLILGPLLTLVAANPAKTTKELRKDFAVIALIQVCALTAGTSIAASSRPWALLWYDGVAYTIPWSGMREEPAAMAALKAVAGDERPRRGFVDLPFDLDLRSDIIHDAELSARTPLFDPLLYRPWPPDPRLLAVFTRISIEMAGADADRLQAALATVRARFPAAELVPTRSRYNAYFLVLDSQNGNVIEVIDIAPDAKLLTGLYPGQRVRTLLETPTATP